MDFDIQPNERIITTFRRHWILFAIEVFGLVVLFFIPLLLSSALPKAITANGTVGFFVALWMLLLWMRLFVVWFKYYFDAWVVTNMRIVDIEQISLFNRKVSTLDPEHIEDITIHVDGFLKSMFGFGDLTVQTAGHVQEFIMKDIKNPEHAKQAVYETMRIAKNEEKQQLAEHITQRQEKREEQVEVIASSELVYLPNSNQEATEENPIMSYYKNN